jgi:hypothetical protein
VIVGPLTPDFSWDEYVDLTTRAFGPVDEAMVRSATEPVATLRRAGLADGGSPDADAALDGAFAATPFMLDGF